MGVGGPAPEPWGVSGHTAVSSALWKLLLFTSSQRKGNSTQDTCEVQSLRPPLLGSCALYCLHPPARPTPRGGSKPTLRLTQGGFATPGKWRLGTPGEEPLPDTGAKVTKSPGLQGPVSTRVCRCIGGRLMGNRVGERSQRNQKGWGEELLVLVGRKAGVHAQASGQSLSLLRPLRPGGPRSCEGPQGVLCAPTPSPPNYRNARMW